MVRLPTCAHDVRYLLNRSSGYSTVQILLDVNDANQSLAMTAAALLISRGLYSTLYFPPLGIYSNASAYPWNSTLLEHDFGAPRAPATEADGVFRRRYERGQVRLDCNARDVAGAPMFILHGDV